MPRAGLNGGDVVAAAAPAFVSTAQAARQGLVFQCPGFAGRLAPAAAAVPGAPRKRGGVAGGELPEGPGGAVRTC